MPQLTEAQKRMIEQQFMDGGPALPVQPTPQPSAWQGVVNQGAPLPMSPQEEVRKHLMGSGPDNFIDHRTGPPEVINYKNPRLTRQPSVWANTPKNPYVNMAEIFTNPILKR